jgi:biopolymer transport protein ExbB
MNTRNSSTLFRSLLCGLLAALVMSGTAHAWWNADWTLRKKITIDTSDKGAGIGDAIGTTPVLIRLHDDQLNFGAAKDDLSDLRFVAADDKTLLTYHVENYDSAMNEAEIWVNVPDVKPGAQISIWLYYGNPKAEGVNDPKKTYDKETALVYHFSESNAPAGDSTANANNSKNAGISVLGSSMIGNGVRFAGKGPITVPAADSLKWINGQPLTWSAWFKPAIIQPNSELFSRRDGTNSFIIGVDNGLPYVEVNGNRNTPPASAAPLAPNSWHHLAVASDGAKLAIYLDGAPFGTLAASLPAMSSDLLIGGDTQPNATGFTGELDELDISSVARPPGFIKFAATGQGADGSKLITIGADEQTANWLSAFNSGTAGILIHSLTPDGWAVIAILAVMAIISWTVMISKASYLGKITKGNDHFLREWRHVAADLTVLDNTEHDIKSLGGHVDAKKLRPIRSAPVFRIYHVGAEEIRHRFNGASASTYGRPKLLSAQSIQAIRAALDATMVKESHKLNNMMVLLTIAISGGPFLGLLGTVIGVMITFASIAAAGEVNVNAIAPGIAAALLATVAGLAVAIPSLFGYNYLTIRIKNATSDMHVFIDEFIAKMAESYSQPPVYRNPGEREFMVHEEEEE